MKKIFVFISLLFSLSCTQKTEVVPVTAMPQVSIYTKFDAGVVTIYLNGSNVGGFSSYFKTGSPAKCGEQGACTVQTPTGTYTLKATSSKGKTWNQTISVSGACSVIELTQ